jgi:sec-independent protein translocase protein TatB
LNIFGIGALELLVILFVTLMVVGPDRVPEYARKASHLINQARRSIAEARETLLPDLDIESTGRRSSDKGPAGPTKS